MRQIIYLDVLLLLNLLVTFLLLMATSLLTSHPLPRSRLLIASLMGSIFSLFIFLKCSPLEEFFLKISSGLLLAFAAFYQKGKSRLFWRAAAGFFLVSFLFAGVMTAIFLLVPAQGMVYRNGVLYFNISALMLAGSSTAAYFSIRMICRLLDKRQTKSVTRSLFVRHGENSVTITAFIDTGNRLRDLFSGLPVIVASYPAIEPLIPPNQRDYVKSGIPPNDTVPMFRLIPVKTVAGEQLLASFLPDCLVLDGAEKRAVLAVSSVSISDGGYDAVIPFCLIT